MGDRIRLNGTSSRRAHEQSTTAIPFLAIRDVSFGQIGPVPTGVRTTPWNLEPPIFRDLMSPRRESFRPEQRRGSQWSKSHIATRKGMVNGGSWSCVIGSGGERSRVGDDSRGGARSLRDEEEDEEALAAARLPRKDLPIVLYVYDTLECIPSLLGSSQSVSCKDLT